MRERDELALRIDATLPYEGRLTALRGGAVVASAEVGETGTGGLDFDAANGTEHVLQWTTGDLERE